MPEQCISLDETQIIAIKIEELTRKLIIANETNYLYIFFSRAYSSSSLFVFHKFLLSSYKK